MSYVTLGDVCTKESSSVMQKELENNNGAFPIYGASGHIKNVNFYKQEKEYLAVVKDGAGVGRVVKMPAKSSVIGTLQYILPNEKVDIDYLYYAMIYMNLSKYFSGATIPHIYFKDYKKERFRLPNIDTQRKISDKFKLLDELSETRKAQIEALDTLIKSRFIEMFGDVLKNDSRWEKQPVFKICSSIFSGGTPSKKRPEYYEGNIPWVSPKDMKTEIINDSIDHITETAVKQSATNLIPANSVLMVIRSGILKHSLPVAINTVPVAINQDMKAFVPLPHVTAQYLMYYLKSIAQDILQGVRAVTADNVDFKQFRNREIPIPPISLQNEFADFVKQVDKSKFMCQSALKYAA